MVYSLHPDWSNFHMTVSCQVSASDMREAFRLNLTPSFWWKAARSNPRAIIYVVVLIAVLITRGRSIEWQQALTVGGLAALFLGLFLWRLHRSVTKAAKALNESCVSLTIDSQGVTAESTNGSKSFTPWSAIHRWREGKSVFTLGDGKTFRTVPKSALDEMQSGELRSLLLSQIR
jgi:hypothetical protein